MMLSAAAVTDNVTRNAMIAQVRGYASSNSNDSVFSGYYNPLQGASINRPGAFSGHGINSYVLFSIQLDYISESFYTDLLLAVHLLSYSMGMLFLCSCQK